MNSKAPTTGCGLKKVEPNEARNESIHEPTRAELPNSAGGSWAGS